MEQTDNTSSRDQNLSDQRGALTGAINYYRAFNNDSNQLGKLPYQKINVSTLILWAEADEYITTPVAEYNREWLNASEVVYYTHAGHWLTRECPSQVTERIRNFTEKITIGATSKPEHAKIEDNDHMKCRESIHPTRHSHLSRLFAWLPFNAKLPREMRE
ncbi:hypothetical protein MTO96_038370 [Rhipicephalus appendiculatus]